MPPPNDTLCGHGNVSGWLYHGSVEINSLLHFQFSLNPNLSTQCKQNLTSYMCMSGLQCFSDPIYTSEYLEDVKEKCELTIKAW